MLCKLPRILKEEIGATAIEYALIAAPIALVIVGAVTVVGTSLVPPFNTAAAAL